MFSLCLCRKCLFANLETQLGNTNLKQCVKPIMPVAPLKGAVKPRMIQALKLETLLKRIK